MDHGETRVSCQPLFHLVTGMARRLIEPYQDLPVGMILQVQLEPAEGRFIILPVDHKTTDFLAGAQMDCPINVLGFLTPGAIRDQGLLSDRIPAPG